MRLVDVESNLGRGDDILFNFFSEFLLSD